MQETDHELILTNHGQVIVFEGESLARWLNKPCTLVNYSIQNKVTKKLVHIDRDEPVASGS